MRIPLLLSLLAISVSGCTVAKPLQQTTADELVDTRIAESASSISLAQLQLHQTAQDRNSLSNGVAHSPKSGSTVYLSPEPVGPVLKFAESPMVVSTKVFAPNPTSPPTIVNVIAATPDTKVSVSPGGKVIPVTPSGQGQAKATVPAKAVAFSQVPQTVPAKPAEAPWVISPTDVTLRRALVKWAARSGWQLVWDAQVDVPIPVTASFSGDFRNAVKQLFQSLSASDVNLTGLLYSGNRVLRVTESGRRAQ